MRQLVSECELTGKRTIFERQGRSVAILISWDEYLAQRETIEISNDAHLRARIEESDAEARKNALMLPEDLNGGQAPSPVRTGGAPVIQNDRIRIAESVEKEWNGLAAHERETALRALAKIDDDPIAGAPLFDPLHGIWSARPENLRILYRIFPEARFILILTITRVAEAP